MFTRNDTIRASMLAVALSALALLAVLVPSDVWYEAGRLFFEWIIKPMLMIIFGICGFFGICNLD